ncbi:hypothetical protein PsorP6_011332 [Peronosclerospora sorghi]|uniref:Uncharacterized protein n=1 Tax=Peronosclerospora sorghi TaxID=230839 RepID=A0ACC0WKS7_9STRA|nr:hypothetical protein PsorP6_011332 [Peronosclerospora sorghi]
MISPVGEQSGSIFKDTRRRIATVRLRLEEGSQASEFSLLPKPLSEPFVLSAMSLGAAKKRLSKDLGRSKKKK